MLSMAVRYVGPWDCHCSCMKSFPLLSKVSYWLVTIFTDTTVGVALCFSFYLSLHLSLRLFLYLSLLVILFPPCLFSVPPRFDNLVGGAGWDGFLLSVYVAEVAGGVYYVSDALFELFRFWGGGEGG